MLETEEPLFFPSKIVVPLVPAASEFWTRDRIPQPFLARRTRRRVARMSRLLFLGRLSRITENSNFPIFLVLKHIAERIQSVT